MPKWTNILFITLFILACKQEKELNTLPAPQANIVFEQPDSTITAGDSVVIMVNVAKPADIKCHLIWSGMMGDHIFSFSGNKPKIEIPIPPNVSSEAGKAGIALICQGKPVQEAIINITPGPATGVIEAYSGPKTITAGTGEQAMVIAIPKDKYGNPAHFDELEFQISYQSKDQLIFKSLNQHFYAYRLIESRREAGIISVGALSGNAAMKEEKLIINPGQAANFTISAFRPSSFADGRSQTRLVTDVIMDNNGNTVTDGSMVTFYAEMEDRHYAKTEAFTLGGKATGYLENPDFPSNLKIRANCGPFGESNELALFFLPVLDSIPVHFTPKKDKIIVGPLLSHQGNFLPDGFPVRVMINGPDFFVKKIELTENGLCTFQVKELITQSGWYTISIDAGGKMKKITLEWK